MFIFDKIETPSQVFKCMARVFYMSYTQMSIPMEILKQNVHASKNMYKKMKTL